MVILPIAKYPLPEKCFGINRAPLKMKGAVIHYMSAVYIDPRLMFDVPTNIKILTQYKFSYHFLIDRFGTIFQLVPLQYQAYHAGKSRFKKLKSCNGHSVGICLLGGAENIVGPADADFTGPQYTACANVINSIKAWSDDFRNDYIVGHEDVAVPKGRKADPGKHFDWAKLSNIMAKTEDNYILDQDSLL